jgi:hypothetical protein
VILRALILALAARLPAPSLDNCAADVEAKRAAVRRQLHQVKHYAKVTCGCGLTLSVMYSFRCLYCGEFYCQRCAEVHFGKTRAAYEHERADYRHAGGDLPHHEVHA